ncbi:transposase [bacterium]|nr:transposase [bacterium]
MTEEIKRERTQRLFFPNHYYHAYNRGNRKQKIYLDEEDFLRFLNLIYYYEEATSVDIYGYCLMPNHYHLLLRLGTNPKDLTRFFHRSMTAYSLYFNRKYKLVGRLCQDRYQYKLLPTRIDINRIKEYLRENPTKAGLVTHSVNYRWLWTHEGKTIGTSMPGPSLIC